MSQRTEPPSSLLETDRRGVVLLAGTGGFVDAAGFLVLFGLFTAQMSGNSTGLCVALATGDWSEALRRGFVIPLFLLATAAGAAWIEIRSSREGGAGVVNRATAGVLTIEALMLLVFAGVALRSDRPLTLHGDPRGFFLCAAAATLAMGLQNAALRRFNRQVVHTTFLTGVMTSLAVAVVHWALDARRSSTDPAARERVTQARFTAALSLMIWSGYLGGAFLGAWLVSRLGVVAVGLPLAGLAVLIWFLHREPRPGGEAAGR